MRDGFTLLEVLIVAGLLLMLAGGAVMYQTSGQKQSLALEFQASSLQSAQLILARLQRDLVCMVPGPLSTARAQPTPCHEVLLTRVSESSDSRGLPLDEKDRLLTDTVVWKFDPATHLISRNGEAIKAAPMETVDFTYFPCRPRDVAPPYGDTLVVRLVAVPSEALGRSTADTPRAVFNASFHSSQGTINHLHEDWAGDR